MQKEERTEGCIMQGMTYGVPQRIPSIVSLSTIAMATDFQYECPSGMFSLLCAVTGSCTLIAANREIPLVGSRMAFLSGNIRYRMKDASPDLSVTRLDFHPAYTQLAIAVY